MNEGIYQEIYLWVISYKDSFYVFFSACIVSMLLLYKEGKEKKEIFPSSLICGFFALGVEPILHHYDLPESYIYLIGPIIGIVGIEKIRHVIVVVFQRIRR